MRLCLSREPEGMSSTVSASTGGQEDLQETIRVSGIAHCFGLPRGRYATVITVLMLIPLVSDDHGAGPQRQSGDSIADAVPNRRPAKGRRFLKALVP